MQEVKSIIEDMLGTFEAITATARDVNRYSHNRKEITSSGMELVQGILKENSFLQSEYEKIVENLRQSQDGVSSNTTELQRNVEDFRNIIENIELIRTTLNTLDSEIAKLTRIVTEIREDTDEIFTLALNASIVSSKYSHTSGVFDILANKLNEMSNFINQNLENIVAVVSPITEGISRLIENNAGVLEDIESGYHSFLGFNDILSKQQLSINEMSSRTRVSGNKIEEQKKMLDELNEKVSQMDEDATGAITGSDNVAKTAEELTGIIAKIQEKVEKSVEAADQIKYVEEQARIVWQTAQNVNEKSRSQLDFSLSSVDFCDQLITESSDLKETTETLKDQSEENNNVAGYLSSNLENLTAQLLEIEKKLEDSNSTISKFNDDYSEIDNIVQFLKNILNSMNVIGMMSRIESARDPEEYKQFMTISENIRELQEHIHNNIPNIEENITCTHELIENVNNYFDSISTKFYAISSSTDGIIKNLGAVTRLSSESKNVSEGILTESKDLVGDITRLREFLMELTEVVKKPIEGSAANIERGKRVESLCSEISDQLLAKNS